MRPIVVAGAGAAGLVAAIFARNSPRQPVVVLESTPDGGRKILISGGGRCNVLPEAIEPQRFVTASSPVTLRRILRSWPLDEQRTFFEQHVGVPLKLERETRKWFPVSDRARDVRDGLVRVARDSGVRFEFGTSVQRIERRGDGVRVHSSAGVIDAVAVILATGGLSVPATGSTGTGFDVARELGITVHETYPALTPLVASPPRHANLAGVSFDVRLRARWGGRTTEVHGGFLFTHRGYSGPAILDVSHMAVRSQLTGDARATVRVQWCDLNADEWRALLTSSPGLVINLIAKRLPERVAAQLMGEAGVPADRRAAELRRSERTTIVDLLTAYELPWTGDEGYKKAEVTAGGISLGEVAPETLESRIHSRVFLCGELLDAFGPIGGHNFAWAWVTGRLAGLAAASYTDRGAS